MSADPLVRVRRAARTKAGAEREYRSALVAAVAAGRSYVELAKVAGTSRQAVRQLVERARVL